jgi:hypothetical protein
MLKLGCVGKPASPPQLAPRQACPEQDGGGHVNGTRHDERNPAKSFEWNIFSGARGNGDSLCCRAGAEYADTRQLGRNSQNRTLQDRGTTRAADMEGSKTDDVLPELGACALASRCCITAVIVLYVQCF